MVNAIKAIFKRIYPHIDLGYDRPRKGIIVAINDPIRGAARASDDFRPGYAASVQLLNEDGTHSILPILEDLPLPAAVSGSERGILGFPDIGAEVLVVFAYGSPGHPMILSLYPKGQVLPDLEQGEIKMQQAEGHHFKFDKKGNAELKTSGQVLLDALNKTEILEGLNQQLGSALKNVEGEDSEVIGGAKVIEALGALKFTTAGGLNMAAAADSQMAFLLSLAFAIGTNLEFTVGQKALIQNALGAKLELTPLGLIDLSNSAGSLNDLITGLITAVDELTSAVDNFITTNGGTASPATKALLTPITANLTTLTTQLGFVLK